MCFKQSNLYFLLLSFSTGALNSPKLSHLGRFGSGMHTIIKSVNRQKQDAVRLATICEMYQSIGAELQRANAALLQAAGTLL